MPAAFVTSNASPLPLVVDVHGHGGDSGSQEDSSMFGAVADEDEEGFFVLTAEGEAYYRSIIYSYLDLDIISICFFV